MGSLIFHRLRTRTNTEDSESIIVLSLLFFVQNLNL